MLHELGHAIGLNHHENTSNPLMYKFNNFIWHTIYRPTKEDIEILLSLHIDLEDRRSPTAISPFHGCQVGICP